MQPKTSSTSYLAEASKAVYDAITSADEKGVWLMQGWLFFSDPAFWQPAQVKAYLQGKVHPNVCQVFDLIKVL